MLGNALIGMQNPQIQNQLVQAMNPQAVAQQAQPSLGSFLAGLQNNPAAIQMLLQSGAQLLNPTTFQRPGGRIAQAASDGVSGYNELQSAAEEKEYQRKMLERQQNREDRKVDLSEQKVNQGEEALDIQREELDTEREKFMLQYGLDKEEMAARKKLWEAQARKWAAEASALQQKMEQGAEEDLTGPERQTNRIAEILENTGMPKDDAYMTAFDVYNNSAGDEAKAIAAVTEKLSFLSTNERGRQMLENAIRQIQESYRGAADILEETRQQQTGTPGGPGSAEVAPGISQQDVQAALDAINRNDGTNLTWDTLNEMQRDRLLQMIQQRKSGGAQ